jgi:hypothetical protein
MDAFAPEFSAFWLEPADFEFAPAVEAAQREEPLSPLQQVALEELVERVNAARSVA